MASEKTSHPTEESVAELITFVGRQPIFDRKMNVYAYEVLFRQGLANVFQGVDEDQATSNVISESFFSLGINAITGGKRASINFTRNVLLGEYAQLLPKDQLIVEILEDVEPEPEVLNAVRRLKERGYLIALDDYQGTPLHEPFIPFADIIKVDFMLTTPETQAALVERFGSRDIRMLAEKVENRKEYERAFDAGYSLFQGFFFCKPVIITGARIPESKMGKIQLLRVVNRSEIDLAEAEAIFKQDVGLSFRLLKYINSSCFGLRQTVTSIGQTLRLLGRQNLRKWASVIAFSALGSDKPRELLTLALIRARFCELLAPLMKLEEREEDLFLLGLFSTIDALLDMSMEQILQDIPLADDLKSALVGEANALRALLEVVIGYEAGDWVRFESLIKRHNLAEEHIPLLHRKAVKMAEDFQFLRAGSEPS